MTTRLSLSMAALVAAGIFALYSAPSFAAATAPRTPTPPCTVNCGGGDGGGDTTDPGDPFFPPGDDDEPEDGDDPKDGGGPGDGGPDDGDKPDDGPGPGGGPGGDPNYPGLNKQEVAELRACIAKLEGLPSVSEGQINQFGQPYKVTLTPVCESRGLTEAGVAIVEKGNVYGLEPALKGNEVIKSKLGQSAYKARDVVGIDFDHKGNAILFVHKKRG